MPLLDEAHGMDPLPPAAAALTAHRFLLRCRQWAVEIELPKCRERVQQSTDPEDAARLHQWISYLQFTDHAIAELESGALDHWFVPDSNP